MLAPRTALAISALVSTFFFGTLFYAYGSPSLPSLRASKPYISPEKVAYDSTSPWPWTAPFSSWFHPHAHLPKPPKSKPEQWNLLYHLGGNGPWVPLIHHAVPYSSLAPPESCEATQVHMLARHHERYPTFSAGGNMAGAMQRLAAANATFSGPLRFLSNYTFFVDDPESQYEQLTSTGPYAGTLGAFTEGVRFRTRYRGLLDATEGTTKIWSSQSDRVEDTAKYFATGFWGLGWEKDEGGAKLVIISEGEERGGDTLTPTNTCVRFNEDAEEGHDLGEHKQLEFEATYDPSIAERLSKFVHIPKGQKKFSFTPDEIFFMQGICGFETTVRGTSPFCALFSHSEWLDFEYGRDVMHFYRSGPGNKYGKAMGMLWLNATAGLLQEGPQAGRLFFSFTHDTSLAALIAALGVLEDSDLSTKARNDSRHWRMSQALPMGGRLTLERLECGTDGDAYVRLNINDGILALPGCDSGPGASCPLDEFIGYVAQKQNVAGVFGEACGLSDDMAKGIEFLHQ
ncbi:phosphoglycerate mutase-like protein [Trichodelitschia bisporula]|uniref:3-phytase n=1 Tax=Trichodelitschia bisporula TaxID=703511 RepID=A0A6G1I7N3_9PEZI|nr:phosphoglycerate mutase-like protein [Trichodelitschia bisporula]